jgi:hypothetical protein
MGGSCMDASTKLDLDQRALSRIGSDKFGAQGIVPASQFFFECLQAVIKH